MVRTKPGAAQLASPDDIEAQFYEALQHGDIERLMAVWADDDDISCVHPGGARVVGAQAIRASFEAMFANGGIDAEPRGLRRVLTHSVAVHSVVERVRVLSEQGPQAAHVIVTNVYIKTGLGWRLVVHHASPGVPGEPADLAEAAAVLH